MSENAESSINPQRTPGPLAGVLRIEWLGQTAASLCWIASVFAYGLSSAGDYLQLSAASAWLIANIAVALNTRNTL
ncbi:MAG: hypothetical protein AAGB51_12605 [Planctomycetota bacterium]